MPPATAAAERAAVRSRPLLLLGVLLLTAALRFYHLGTWQYTGDEMSSVAEERVLLHGAAAAPESQEYRLPHAIPLGYLAIHLSHSVFGDDERGTRVVMALLGTLSVAVVFLFLSGPLSERAALFAALLLALLPWHVVFSQMTRFYILAALLSFAALIAGARVVAGGGRRWAIVACALSFIAVLAHTVLLALLPLIAVAIVAGFRAQGRPVPRPVWTVFALTAAALALLAVLYLWPLLHGWNRGESWGYSPLHGVLASIVTIGWSGSLLVCVGAALLLRERSAQGWYWLVCLGGWLVVSAVAPLLITYHPGYAFPFVISAIVVAAYAIAYVFELLRERVPLAAWTWGVLSCCGSLPALASYYVDGSRNDIRGAASWVRAHWQAGDRLAGYSVGALNRYDGECCAPQIPLPLGPGAVPKLAQLAAAGGRIWVVLENKRSGLDPAVQAWLFACAEHRLSLGGRRFDDEEFKEEVYLVAAPLSGSCVRAIGRGPAASADAQ
jgi:hypothetical protein